MYTEAFNTILSVLRVWFRSRCSISAELLSLRHQLSICKRSSARPRIRPFDRLVFIFLKKFHSNWKRSLIIVSPDTVVSWHRQLAKGYWAFLSSRSRRPGRPTLDKELISLIKEMAHDNPIWGASRIHGELIQLGFKVSERTVARYLARFPRNERQQQSWRTFLSNHAHEICSMDFFTEFTVGFRQIYGLILVDHGRRRIIHTAATFSPTKDWILQQLCNAFPGECPYKYLICDNDRKFGKYLIRDARELLGLEVKQTSFRSPWQNGICERTIGTIRQELLNHIIPLNRSHLASQLSDFQNYFNGDRTHRSLDKDSPISRRETMIPGHELLRESRIGGLHHRYLWNEAA